MAAGELGLHVVKFFPAQAIGGVAVLRALYGPFPDVRFVPTGGISQRLLPDYPALPSVLTERLVRFIDATSGDIRRPAHGRVTKMLRQPVDSVSAQEYCHAKFSHPKCHSIRRNGRQGDRSHSGGRRIIRRS